MLGPPCAVTYLIRTHFLAVVLHIKNKQKPHSTLIFCEALSVVFYEFVSGLLCMISCSNSFENVTTKKYNLDLVSGDWAVTLCRKVYLACKSTDEVQ